MYVINKIRINNVSTITQLSHQPIDYLNTIPRLLYASAKLGLIILLFITGTRSSNLFNSLNILKLLYASAKLGLIDIAFYNWLRTLHL